MIAFDQGVAKLDMSATDDDRFGAVIKRLDKLMTLSPSDKAVIRALPFTPGSAPADHYLVR